MSYVLNGVYHKDGQPPKREQHDGYREWHRDRQRDDHRKDMVQPYSRDGKPSEEFMHAYPEQSKKYGFIKEEENGKN